MARNRRATATRPNSDGRVKGWCRHPISTPCEVRHDRRRADPPGAYHSSTVIWKDPVTAMQRTKALGLLHKTIRTDSSMSRMGIPDRVVTLRKPGENTIPITHGDDYPVSRWQKIASPIWDDINPSDTLQFRAARDANDERHIAPLQLEVIRRCVELWSAPGDIVLTPFAGIGSELYVAVTMGRRAVGVELKPSYFQQAVRNLKQAEGDAAGDLFSETAA